jgi:hypothetical protein
MKNDYKICGDTTIIYMDSPKYGRIEAVISTDDLPRAMEFPNRWGAIWCKGTDSFYISGKYTISFKKRRYVYLHRWILGMAESKTVVDHINRDTLNNTRDNLNVVTQAENVQNRRKQRNNTSGYPGVTWAKTQNKWLVTINDNGVQKYVGMYEDINDAADARKLVEIQFNPYKQEVINRKMEANE